MEKKCLDQSIKMAGQIWIPFSRLKPDFPMTTSSLIRPHISSIPKSPILPGFIRSKIDPPTNSYLQGEPNFKNECQSQSVKPFRVHSSILFESVLSMADCRKQLFVQIQLCQSAIAPLQWLFVEFCTKQRNAKEYRFESFSYYFTCAKSSRIDMPLL